MDDFILKITAEIVITQEDVDDIMSTALDSSTSVSYTHLMSLEIFLLLLLIVSIFTGLFTEGIKKLLDEVNKKYHSNFLAGFVAVVLSVLVDIGYIILTEAQINACLLYTSRHKKVSEWFLILQQQSKFGQILSRRNSLIE